MREHGGNRGGGKVVAAAVAELEKQALVSGRQKPTPSVKTQSPEDNSDHKHSSDSDENDKNEYTLERSGSTGKKISTSDSEITENVRNIKSGSPLTRSESIGKKISSRNNPRDSPRNSPSKVTVIAAKLKQNATNFKGLLNDTQEVDALCMDLMTNLQEAINEKESTNGSHEILDKNLNVKDFSKSTRSGFSYVDIKQYENGRGYSDSVVLRKNSSLEHNGENRNSSSTTESVYTSEDIETNSSDDDTDSSDSESSSSSEERVHIVNEGLETITEEDRPVTASSIRSKEGMSYTSTIFLK